jgi:hypothetical protein
MRTGATTLRVHACPRRSPTMPASSRTAATRSRASTRPGCPRPLACNAGSGTGGTSRLRQRGHTVEPVFGQIKNRPNLISFSRRGIAPANPNRTWPARRSTCSNLTGTTPDRKPASPAEHPRGTHPRFRGIVDVHATCSSMRTNREHGFWCRAMGPWRPARGHRQDRGVTPESQ